jgi:hypothetical protein
VGNGCKSVPWCTQADTSARGPAGGSAGPNQRWSRDFLSDAFLDGRQFQILAIVDDLTRDCLALIADTYRDCGSCVNCQLLSPGAADRKCASRQRDQTDRHLGAALEPGDTHLALDKLHGPARWPLLLGAAGAEATVAANSVVDACGARLFGDWLGFASWLIVPTALPSSR